ncbi:biotin synthase [Candidatus Kuenenia stuttgartiensis]|jgi:biotin synthase|uniref:Biotin synthase n=2 Tax=Kuenenia stuttgartiensis TaxID=174633 RepID=Q1Q6F4_KUEST|nr:MULTISPECIES: biotin synthase BioB [Kuenenia]MBE7548387.1 biotin synthase BioB [Planctomycetia bacterium]MBZ0192424.1 biotin synthase BioB [Candidatus Kuenenia stuttgartiensis]MCL4726293.1 biotin synthase BioB [Candidatus Kuenenia stuttgartiensis]MCZ7620958.1 biotin synthase BioB [Candidatus Kuenenia sp.]QII13039.1 biotin synthase [Candidatus Kuenenia stuttgartiensis]
MHNRIETIAQQSLQNNEISHEDAIYLSQAGNDEVYDLFYWANRIRLKYFGQTVKACSIVSAKQGTCTEDCAFCSQSSYYPTAIEKYNLIEENKIVDAALYAENTGAHSLGIVTSGYSIDNENELDRVCRAISTISRDAHIHPHGSFGVLTREMADALAKSGLKRINHNLETSERFFRNICTTHTYADRLNTIYASKQAGLEICCGAIFGIGEETEDRIHLAFTLKKLDVDSVPLNFLHPIPGTPMGNRSVLTPMEILKIISLFRFILPDKEIKIAGGREKNLRSLQSWMFYAGANSTMIGNYLTTKGKPGEEDLQMIKDLGLELERTSNDEMI